MCTFELVSFYREEKIFFINFLLRQEEEEEEVIIVKIREAQKCILFNYHCLPVNLSKLSILFKLTAFFTPQTHYKLMRMKRKDATNTQKMIMRYSH